MVPEELDLVAGFDFSYRVSCREGILVPIWFLEHGLEIFNVINCLKKVVQVILNLADLKFNIDHLASS